MFCSSTHHTSLFNEGNHWMTTIEEAIASANQTTSGLLGRFILKGNSVFFETKSGEQIKVTISPSHPKDPGFLKPVSMLAKELQAAAEGLFNGALLKKIFDTSVRLCSSAYSLVVTDNFPPNKKIFIVFNSFIMIGSSSL